jgi:multicomponent K+:H+ antiporter subunit E
MRRVLPSPALSSALFVLWMLLMQSWSMGTLVLGAVFSLFWPAITAGFMGTPLRIHRPLRLARLIGCVVKDMLISNLRVGYTILARPARELRPGFIAIPLELRDPNGLAALAMIITFTPGTAWAQLSADHRVLLVHVFDTGDAKGMATFIQERYERPLREIFP